MIWKKFLSLLQNMRLYNGYHVATSEESCARINLEVGTGLSVASGTSCWDETELGKQH